MKAVDKLKTKDVATSVPPVGQSLGAIEDRIVAVEKAIANLPSDAPLVKAVDAINDKVAPIIGTIEKHGSEIADLAASTKAANDAHAKAIADLRSAILEKQTPKSEDHCEQDLVDRIHASDEYKNYWAKGAFSRGGPELRIPSMTLGRKTVLTSTHLGDLVPLYSRPGVVEYPQAAIGIVDLIPRIPAGGIETVSVRTETRETAHGSFYTTLAADVVEDDGVVATLANVDGVVAGSYLYIYGDDTLYHKCKVSSVDPATKIVTFTATLDFDAAEDNAVSGEVTGVIAESGTKPFGMAKISADTLTMKCLPTLLELTQARLNAAPQLRAWLESKMPMRARRNLAWHLLYGDGSEADQLAGFFGQSGAQTYSWSSGSAGDTMADAVVIAAESIETEGTVYLVTNKTQWGLLKRAKAEDGHYIHGNGGMYLIVDLPGSRSLGPHPVILDAMVDSTDFLVFDPSNASELYDQGIPTLAFGYYNEQFIKNEVTARYEETLIHAILTTLAYCHGSFDAAPGD